MARGRVPLLVIAAAALAAGVWGGLARMGLLPPAPGESGPAHGALLVTGFVGTLVGLERAVVTRRWWAELVPAFAALAAAGTVAGLAPPLPALLALFAALVFTAVATRGAPASPRSVRIVMAVSALAWAAGCATWAMGLPAFRASPWWLAFAVLVIAAERMELSRVLRPTATDAVPLALGAAVLVGGAVLSVIDAGAGPRVAGAGALILTLWLVVRDRPAVQTRPHANARYTAAAISLAYAWLAVGALLLITNDAPPAGPRYDATTHALFVGFVITMIFAHGPMLVPTVAGAALVFRRSVYLPLIVLQAALLARLLGDIVGATAMRDTGVIGIATALVLYAVVMAASVRRRRAITRQAVDAAGLR